MGKQQAIEERTLEEALFIIDNKATVRETAANSKVSKSTTHKDLTVRLKKYSPLLAEKVRKILDINYSEKHIRGGMATKKKFVVR